jgi:hypothetical protein
MIHNGHGRSERLKTRNVAITTFDVLKLISGREFETPERLREHFKISEHSKLLLVSVAKDNVLERYWKYEVSRRLPEQLRSLGVQFVTAPNYSFPTNVPRTEPMANRMRSLKSAERLSAVGLYVIPHLNSCTQADWDCWRDFLRDHKHINIIALEFQTGLRIPRKAVWHISQLLNVQEALGRGLHLVAVAGRNHLRMFMGLSGVTVVDSGPFVRACMRRRLIGRRQGKWVVTNTPVGMPIDSLLKHNIAAYGRGVREGVEVLRRLGATLPSYTNAIHEDQTCTDVIDTDAEHQYLLAPDWFSMPRLHAP